MTTILTVAIVTYRSPLEEVVQAVASVLSSTLNLHLMVVDNDSGSEYFTALRTALPAEVEFIAAPRNGGFGYGHNLALLQAPPAPYHLILNPDVIVHAGALETLISFLSARPEAGLVVPKVLYQDGRLQPLNKRNPNVLDLILRRLPASPFMQMPAIVKRLQRYQMLDVGYDEPCRLEFASGCCMVFKRDILQRLGGFDERFFLYFEDADLTRRVNCISEAWYCPEAVITHRWHRASKHSAGMFRILLTSANQYFTKWGWALW